ncbi:MAG: DNA polymerase III, subunit gamma and tau [Deltaproteobacteria bacterium RIFCSPLOWO2_01_44_7]|nr:MAG: DNA polymerase III, subunit gamma and tau [Deltaproteobacteria bacterium RIFCSPHIGHO2_01_FULL_43_49]OGQ14523.1 MAG: DNA polymerase III, subunit gamma and tau [Deltaproteobacteria bacterium RIFCSPHIGHO2_02_FULL_44_53]OGQ27909.1 MAG: DNA polymerase III, subunit gamma and tau [Deltaproteobacteria bacterium RIFCSPHIGHO2_12_FULL_44_21]OGQ31121.1 MAG: DNA polymerase III, subunit gamma and tau [Deltaproteobacteria bacterium RIFCSPLOWO2_01_FULL_45_74]OGQ38215.1 MAG: DNA polymerase III, subunit 
MSYQVLARKYRPQLFKEVVGQLHATQTLQNALDLKRIHHAYLFTGARGIGKTTVARILAKALNCETGISKEPCNKCPNCVGIIEGRFLDVQEVDGASNTSVDDVRQIREQVKYLPAKGRYKIYIIDEVHMLSTSAFNALLKTLEEPPPHVVFIFATTESHKIPATILSRCQRYDFRRIATKELVTSLEALAKSEKVEVDEEALHLIAHEAGGSLRDAQSLLDQSIAFAGNKVSYEDLKQMLGFLDRKQLWDLLESLLKKDRKTALNQLDIFYQAGSDLNRLAQDLLANIRNILLIKSLGNVPEWLDLPKEERTTLEKLSALVSLEECDQLFSLVYRTTEEVARSQFPKMVFEVYLVRMTQVTQVIPLSEVLEKLDQMVGQSPPPVLLPLVGGGIKGEGGRGKGWADFVSWLQKEKPQWASIVGHGQLIEIGEKLVTLGFEEGSVYGEMLQEEDRKKQFGELTLKFFGKPLGLRVVSVQPQTSAKVDAQERKKSLKNQALAHESVKEAANILGAIVEEVRTDLDK